MDEEKFQFKCDFCEKSFFNEQILGLHIKSNHKTIIEGKKKCDFCDKIYSRTALYEHLKMVHSKEKKEQILELVKTVQDLKKSWQKNREKKKYKPGRTPRPGTRDNHEKSHG